MKRPLIFIIKRQWKFIFHNVEKKGLENWIHVELSEDKRDRGK